MNTYQDNQYCVAATMQHILHEQMNIQQEPSSCDKQRFHFPNGNSNNTIPFLLYENGQPFLVDGVTTCFNNTTQKEKFICFKTFIFRIVAFDGHCAVLELLKFKHHKEEGECESLHSCTPCCQIHNEDVKDLVATGVCIRIDAGNFTAIQCLPSIYLPSTKK